MSTLYFVLVLFVGLTLVQAKPASRGGGTGGKWKCDDADKKKIDIIVAQIMTYGRTDRRFPVNSDELKNFCKELNNLSGRLESYKDQCLSDQPKQVVGVIVYSIRGLINSYCKNQNSKRSKELLASAPCANKASNGYKKCNDEYVDKLYAVYNSKDSKQRLAQMCCGYVDIFKCMEVQAKKAECSEAIFATHKTFINSFFEGAANLICNEYNEHSDKCDGFSRVVKSSKSGKFPPVESYFHPLVHTLSNL